MKSLKSFFLMETYDLEIFRNELNFENLKRVYYLLLFAIPISTIEILFISKNLNNSNSLKNEWASLIIILQSVFLFFAVFFSLYIYRYSLIKKEFNWKGKIIIYTVLVIFLLEGVAITAVDQLLFTSISPYLITSIIVGLLFLLPPSYSIVYYTIAFVLFYFGMSITQLNSDVFSSNIVNGLSITLVGFVLSVVLWKSNLLRIKQGKKIIEQNNSLKEINAEKDKFLSIISHDLKNPFNSIIGFSGLLKESAKDKDYEAVLEYSDIINRSSQSVYDLLLNLIEWSRSQTGRLTYKPEKLSFINLLKNNLLLFEEAAEKKSITVETETIPDDQVLADEFMISSVLRNLISNAIKFTPKGGKITVSTKKTGDHLLVSIQDNGVGIPEKHMDQIFNLGKNFSTKGTDDEKGTGLGLLLSKEFIEKHHGKIWVESEENKGSAFRFIIPAL